MPATAEFGLDDPAVETFGENDPKVDQSWGLNDPAPKVSWGLNDPAPATPRARVRAALAGQLATAREEGRQADITLGGINSLEYLARTATSPIVPIPKTTGAEIRQAYPNLPGPVADLVAGVQQGAAGVVESVETPLNLAAMGAGAVAPTIGRVVAGTFAVKTAESLPEQARQLGTAIGEGNVEKATAAAIGTAASGLVLAPLARHAIYGTPKPTAAAPAAEVVAPLTSQAVRELPPVIADVKAAETPAPKTPETIPEDIGAVLLDAHDMAATKASGLQGFTDTEREIIQGKLEDWVRDEAEKYKAEKGTLDGFSPRTVIDTRTPTAIDFVRAEKRGGGTSSVQLDQPAGEGGTVGEAVPSGEATPAEAAHKADVMSAWGKAVAALDPEERAAVQDSLSGGDPLPETLVEKLKAGLATLGIGQEDLVGMGGAVPKEFLPVKKFTTANKNAVIDQEREARGLPPMAPVLRRSWGVALDEAKAKADADPTWQDRLIAELRNKPRPTTDAENAGLDLRRVDLRNEFEKAAAEGVKAADEGRPEDAADAAARANEWSNKLAELEQATGKGGAGTELGRGLASRRMMLNEDFSLASLELKARAARNFEPLSDTERASLQKMAREHAEKSAALEKRVAEVESQKAAIEVQAAIDRAASEAAKTRASPHVISLAEKIVAGWDTRADAARARLREKFARTSAGVDPTILIDLAEVGLSHLGHVGLDFARWSAEMIKDFGDVVKPHLEEVFKRSQELSLAATAQGPEKTKLRRVIAKEGQTEQATTAEKVKAKVQAGDANITGDVQKLVRGFVEQGITDRVKLVEAVHAVLKEADPEITFRDAMDAISGYGKYKLLTKDDISVQVRDIKGQLQQVAKLEDMQAGKAPAKTGIERRTPSDEERRLIKQVEEAKKKGGYNVTDPATQLRSALQERQRRLDNQIADLQHEIATKTRTVKTRTEPPTSPKIEELKAKRDALKAERDDLLGKIERTDAQILQSYKTRLANRMAELQAKLDAGDFTKKARREIKLDPEATKLQFELQKIQQKFQEGLMRDRLARRTIPQKIMGGIGETLNTFRALMTSFDLSAVLRQGGFIALGHPMRAVRALPAMFTALRSEAGRFRVDQEILARPNYPLYRQSKLYLSEHGQKLSQMEEAYMSRWAEKIPGVGASERAYTTFLNVLRADSFDAMAKTLSRDGTLGPKEADAVSNFINVATGRGNIGLKENALVGLNTIFFAPRYVASRFNLLGLEPLYRGTAKTRALVASEYARYLIGVGVVYGLGKMAGASVETDPRSSDFGKIKLGNTRIDPMSGLAQTTVFLSRLASGETKSLKGSKITPLRGDKLKRGDQSEFDVMARFARTKLSPALGTSVNLLTGTDVVGQPVTAASTAQGLLVPMALSDIYKAMMDQGVPRGTAISLLSVFGMGVQTFDERAPKAKP